MQISSGIQDLDNLLGGLLAGDNVVWVTTSQGVVTAIEQAFLTEGRRRDEPCTYVTTDAAPASLRAKLGAGLRILDARPGRPLADATALETRILDDARQDPGRVVIDSSTRSSAAQGATAPSASSAGCAPSSTTSAPSPTGASARRWRERRCWTGSPRSPSAYSNSAGAASA